MEVAASTPLEWLIGILVTIGIATAGVIAHIYVQLGAVSHSIEIRFNQARLEAEDSDNAIWNAHNDHVRNTQVFREDSIRQIGGLATRSDVEKIREDMHVQHIALLAELSRISTGKVGA